jgi:hypothetical protein
VPPAPPPAPEPAPPPPASAARVAREERRPAAAPRPPRESRVDPDEDEDDRPRSRRRKEPEPEEDEDDRPRPKRRKEAVEEEDEDRPRPSRKKEAAAEEDANPFAFGKKTPRAEEEDERPRAGRKGGKKAAKAEAFDWGDVDEERKQSRGLDPGWQKVERGLAFLWWGALINAVAVVLFGIVFAAFRGIHGPEAPLFAALPVLLGLAAGVLFAVGLFFCAGAPKDSGVAILALVGGICAVSGVLSPIGGLLALLVLRGIAVYFENRRLAGQVIVYLVGALLAPALACGAGFVLAFATHSPSGFAVFFVGMAGLAAWFLSLVARARRTITAARLGRRAH